MQEHTPPWQHRGNTYFTMEAHIFARRFHDASAVLPFEQSWTPMALSWALHMTYMEATERSCSPIVLPWYFHGNFKDVCSMMFPWKVHGALVVFPRVFRGLSWCFHGASMVLAW